MSVEEKELFRAKKHGKYSNSIPSFLGGYKNFNGGYRNLIDSVIELNKRKLIISHKKGTKNILIALKEIKKVEKTGTIYWVAKKCEYTVVDEKKICFILIILKNGSEYYITFFGKSGFKRDLLNRLFNLIIEELKELAKSTLSDFKTNLNAFIEPYDEISFQKISQEFGIKIHEVENEIKNRIKDGTLKARLLSDKIVLRETTPTVEQTVYITIPPRTKITALNCPNCNAPMEYIPPCKCEHCGVMIELMK